MSGFESIVGVNLWTAIFTFCNMIITFLLLRKFLFKPVKKMIDDRQQEIDDLYSDANRSKEEANALCAEYEQHLTEAKKERDEIIKDAVSRATQREQDIIADANASADAIREKAHADVMQEKKKVLNEAKNEISDLAMDIATKVIEKEIDAEKHQSLVEEFIEKIGDEE